MKIQTTTHIDSETGRVTVETELSFPFTDMADADALLKETQNDHLEAIQEALANYTKPCWLCGATSATTHTEYLHRWYDPSHPDWKGYDSANVGNG